MQRIGYIGGTSFSGSTMLTLLLAMHPDVYSMGQAGPIRAVREKGGRQFCSCGERLDECPLLRGIGDAMAESGFELDPNDWQLRYELDDPRLERVAFGLFPYEIPGRARHAVRRRVPGWRNRFAEVDRRFLAFVDASLAVSGRQVLVDATKDPERLRFLRELPLDLRLVHLVRDPRAMAHSALGRGRDLAPTVDWWVKTHLNLEARARELPSEHRMVLRYEDLGVAPTESLDRVYRVFGVRTSEECQLPEPDEYRDVEHHVSGGRASRPTDSRTRIRRDDRWRDELDRETSDRIWARAGEVAERFGYER